MLHEALQKQCKKARFPVDFSRAYWTPPLTPKLAYETEKNQIENTLGLKSLVSLTDHDNIEAPLMLLAERETANTPISLEWSVPFQGTIFHLGVHNLPSRRAQAIMDELAGYTRNPNDRRLIELLAMLDELPSVLVVFNHPLWTQTCVGVHRDGQVLDRFLSCAAHFLHAFEINAARSTRENNRVGKLAERWECPLVSGGDRHGCVASGALNLTGAESFGEFVGELRQEQRSHVLLMPQYTEPVSVRTTRTLLDVIRNYPEYPIGSRRWDERIFHPDGTGGPDRPISSLWKAPPGFLEQILSGIRLLENATVQSAMQRLFQAKVSEQPREIAPEIISAEEVVSSEALS
ncbi:MAG: PHP domain-containing protein [Candidatus Sulfotelmatobacter sp.]